MWIRSILPSMAHEDYITRSHLRLRTIVRLRWIAILGQLAAVFIVYFGLNFTFPLNSVLMVIGLSIAVNMVLVDLVKTIKIIGNMFGTWMLGFDIIQLTVLLYLTGGILNPFACLLVAPIAISAASLRTQSTVFLAILALAAATFISFFYLPLPWETEHGLVLPVAYRIGSWLSVLCAMVFIGFFAWRIANEGRVMSAALAATEATLAREQKLSAIDGLAAAAAHGLGTPLSTISLVAKEVERELGDENPLKDDVRLIRSQAVRCREILQSLTEEGSDGDLLVASSTIGDVLEEVAQPLKALNARIDITATCEPGVLAPYDREPVLARNAGLIYGLGNILENAVEFAESKVTMQAVWDRQKLKLMISDDGKGFSETMLSQLGEPFISSRSLARNKNLEEGHEGHGGMGLGFFISKTLLERSGAVVRFGNLKMPNRGAFVTLKWPREMIDIQVPRSS